MISYINIGDKGTCYRVPTTETDARNIGSKRVTVQLVFEQSLHIAIDATCRNPYIWMFGIDEYKKYQTIHLLFLLW